MMLRSRNGTEWTQEFEQGGAIMKKEKIKCLNHIGGGQATIRNGVNTYGIWS